MTTPEEAVVTMIRNLEEKTGKSLEQWIAIAGASGHTKHGEVVSFLKEKRGLGHGYANLVVTSACAAASSSR